MTLYEQIATHCDLLHCRAEGLLKMSAFSSDASAAVLQLRCGAAAVLAMNVTVSMCFSVRTREP